MRLKFEPFDGRASNDVDVIDEETGTTVGHVKSWGVGPYSNGGIYVSLFGDKYRGQFHRREECWGFVKGVESVLNHITVIEPPAWAKKISDSDAA